MSNNIQDPNKESFVRELFKAGAHFGFTRSRRHPSVSNFIFGYKNRSAVIDLEKSVDSLATAKDFIATVAAAGKQVLWVATKSEARPVVERVARELNQPYVTERWIGGTFTNFSQIKKRIARLQDLTTKEEKGELLVYTKKERGRIAKEVQDLNRYFASLSNMDRLPGAVFVVDAKEEQIAVEEASKVNIPVIALCGSDCDIRNLAYPIVGNDAAQGSIAIFVKELAQAYQEGAKRYNPAPAPEAAAAGPEQVKA
jgi:small subunit ribosomal protein S2